MRSLPRGRPGHATVVAYVALFVALGGTAVAAKIQSNEIAKNAVKTKKIANAAVTNPKIANFAVNNSKLADDAVTEAKLAPDSVSGNKIQQASIGTGKLREGAVETDKIADGAVTGAKVLDGSLGLLKVAAVVQEASPDPPSVPAGQCADAPNVDVPGIQAGDTILVLPRPNPGSNSLTPGASGLDPGTGQVNVVFCNGGSGAADVGPQRVTIAAFR
jgi:hypothetical protein